tara:strand:- start:3399 stop:3965 length:567 start_codon:yes stop_codon:yes gene_type:complete
MYRILLFIIVILFFPTNSYAQNVNNTVTSTVTGTNTVTGTSTIDRTPPTAASPSIVLNNNDVCKQGMSGAVQTGLLGVSSGITWTDKNCERLKLSRSLYAMGMKVAAVSALCQDSRVFDAMLHAGTPCPYRGKIGKAALEAWRENPLSIPEGASVLDNDEVVISNTQLQQKKNKSNEEDPFDSDGSNR